MKRRSFFGLLACFPFLPKAKPPGDWISVKDRLPVLVRISRRYAEIRNRDPNYRESRRVLTFNRGGGGFVKICRRARFWQEDDVCWVCDQNFEAPFVTHWMELPKGSDKTGEPK